MINRCLLWLIRMATGERRLLTQGHQGRGFKTHPHASFTPDSRGIVFASSHFESDDILLDRVILFVQLCLPVFEH